MNMKNYLLGCCDEADRKEAFRIKELKDRQSTCEHKNLSRASHIGMGWMSQHCIDCGKDFGYDDRG